MEMEKAEAEEDKRGISVAIPMNTTFLPVHIPAHQWPTQNGPIHKISITMRDAFKAMS